MVRSTSIPEPKHGIFRVLWIGNDGNNDTWLCEKKKKIETSVLNKCGESDSEREMHSHRIQLSDPLIRG